MRAVRALAAGLALIVSGAAQAECTKDGDFVAFYPPTDLFEDALATTENIRPSATPLSGLVVPHHLVAPDLIAGGLRLATEGSYKRIILLHPDHFEQLDTPFGTTKKGFQTIAGPVPTDAAGADALLSSAAPLSTSCLFDKDHGIRALLPFVARIFPGVPVLPVAVAIDSSRADWEALANALEPLTGAKTLILQSTDFSHYLPHHIARQRDQQTMNVIASGDLDALTRLRQPDHLDSPGAMYVHTRLQQDMGAAPIVVQNRNAVELGLVDPDNTTSYVVIAYGHFPHQAQDIALPGAETWLIAGDMFLGRDFARVLEDELAERRVEMAVSRITQGLPLIANLEGVLLPELPGTLDHMVLAMPTGLVQRWARKLGIRAVSLANNHAMDIGPSGYAETREGLAAAGIDAIGQGEQLMLGQMDIVALTDLGGNRTGARNLLDDALLDRLVTPDPERPVIAFVHWGQEYETGPTPREVFLAEEMSARGAAVIIGAHSHRAGTGVALAGGSDTAVVHSLGNFMFDQTSDVASGAIAELRVFPQGTVFVRSFPIDNLFEAAIGQGN
jgi:AmmeMemoRadiSam system protein B